ncbi:MAG: RNA 2',3'-cyclic phosphodiesterase [Caldilineae bacterium]|nr:MAG: RNA 2',3'-cyclic phosphodiesterase [Caldilineae bacterium]
MRTFIAIELPPSLKERLSARRDEMRDHLAASGLARHLSWTGDDKFHLTLRFLGETNEQQVQAVATQLARVGAGTRPLSLQLQGLGAFPNWPRLRVLWMGVQGDLPHLNRLQAAVEQAVQANGFPAETRPFHGHITLARMRRSTPRDEAKRIASLLQAAAQARGWGEGLAPWTVEDIVFMRSELHPSGARYTVLGRFQLAKEDGARGPASTS